MSTAFSVLSDGDKKADYDRWGPDGPPTMGGPGGGFGGRRGHGFGVSEDEAERIFRMFFGGGGFGGFGDDPAFRMGGNPFFQQRVYQQRRAQRPRQQEAQQPQDAVAELLVRLLFMLPLILMGFQWLFGASAVNHAFEQSRRMPYPLETSGRGVTFFVEDVQEFYSRYPLRSHKLRAKENEIEGDWRGVLENRCGREIKRVLASQVDPKTMEMPACWDLYDKYKVTMPYWIAQTPRPVKKVNLAGGARSARNPDM